MFDTGINALPLSSLDYLKATSDVWRRETSFFFFTTVKTPTELPSTYISQEENIMADLVKKNAEDLTNEDWVGFLQIVEQLGGSAGVKKALDKQADKPDFKRPEDFPKFTAANLNSGSLLFATYVNVNTTDGHSGSGWGIGPGAGMEITGGVLGYNSWEELTSKPNKFTVTSVEDGVIATFWVDDNPAAGYFGAGAELDVSISGGVFTWDQDGSK
ncbi:hypothetical protein F5B20DRAFT_522094 [Whalleya microplaca]|nr:hypothetical protein F5B20DRAFT_522094 [Whalleya microplaca]